MRRSLLVALAVVVLVAAVAAYVFLPRRGGSESPGRSDDPRLAYEGPFQNVHPSVRYVGDDKCAECHFDLSLSYAEHPMGRSLAPIGDHAASLPYDSKHNNPFEARGLRLTAERDGRRVTHRQERPDAWSAAQEVHFVVGSGTRGYSYFAERDGFVFQTPISWFTQKKLWDLSPGFLDATWPGRLVPTGCLQCHANGVKPLAGHADRFEPGVFAGHAIGCERCHGPGEKHAGGVAGAMDPTIVNPARLSWQLRESVCEQCHLGGALRELRRGRDWFDYRPGMPLSDFVTVLVTNPELPGDHKAVGQVEQMRRSKCYEKSDGAGKLGCVSCHDPHSRVDPEVSVRFYRERCLKCHQDKGCSSADRLKLRPDDSCIACHMPRAATADIAHTALSDHTIPRTPIPKRPASTGPASPFVLFHATEFDAERKRDLSVGLIRLAGRGQVAEAIRRAVVSESARSLEGRLNQVGDDAAGWKALGVARAMERRSEDALAAYRKAHELAPKDDEVLSYLAELEGERGRADAAAGWWKLAAEANPYLAKPQRELTALLARRRDWAGAAEHAAWWVRLEPDSADARRALLRALAEQGRRAEAERELGVLRKLKPADLDEVEAWWRRRK